LKIYTERPGKMVFSATPFLKAQDISFRILLSLKIYNLFRLQIIFHSPEMSLTNSSGLVVGFSNSLKYNRTKG